MAASDAPLQAPLDLGPATRTEFEVFARERWQPAVGVAMRMTANRDEAEDLVAQAMGDLWRRWSETAVANPWAYLRQSLRNGMIDRYRKADRERSVLARLDRRPGFVDRAPVEDRDALVGGLPQLTPVQRQVLALQFLLDLDQQEIARRLAVPVGTIKSHASRGLRRLRAVYEAELLDRRRALGTSN